jgi:hypothetical protein
VALDFAGTDDYLSTVDGTARVTTTPLTLACWFNSDSQTADQVLLAASEAGAGNRDGFYMFAGGAQAGDPVLATTRNADLSSSASSTTGYTAGTWHHACAVFASATDRRAFIDGGSKGTNATSRTPAPTRYLAGISNELTFDINGRLAELGIWNVALTDEEVAALGRGYSPLLVRPASLVEYWRCIEGTGATVVRNFRSGGPEFTIQGDGVSRADHPRIIQPLRALINPKSAGGAVNRVVDVDPANFALTLAQLVPRVARNQALSPTSFGLTPASLAQPVYGRVVTLNRASFAFAPSNLGLQAAYRSQLTAASFALTGRDLTPSAGRKTALTATSFAFNPSALGTLVSRNATLSPASFALTPNAISPLSARYLVLSPASYAVTLASLTPSAGRKVTLSAASFATALVDIEVVYTPGSGGAVNYSVELTRASFALSASSLTPTAKRSATLSATTYSLSASALATLLERNVSLSPAAYALSASDLTAKTARYAELDPASFALSAADLSTLLTRVVSLSPAAFAFEGLDLTVIVDSGGATYAVTLTPVSFAFSPGGLENFVLRGAPLDDAERVITAAARGKTITAPGRLRKFVSSGRDPIVAPGKSRTIVSDGNEPLT